MRRGSGKRVQLPTKVWGNLFSLKYTLPRARSRQNLNNAANAVTDNLKYSLKNVNIAGELQLEELAVESGERL
jgi:hypothetical protein